MSIASQSQAQWQGPGRRRPGPSRGELLIERIGYLQRFHRAGRWGCHRCAWGHRPLPEQRHRVVHHGRRRHRHLPRPPVSAAPSCTPCAPVRSAWGAYLAVLHGWGHYPRVKEARWVQYPSDFARKMCNTEPIIPVDDRPVVSGRYCTPTGDRCQLSGRQREEVEASVSGDLGQVEAKERVGEGDGEAGEDTLVDLGLAGADEAAPSCGRR